MKKPLLTLALSAATISSLALNYPGTLSGTVGSDQLSTTTVINIPASAKAGADVKVTLPPFDITYSGMDLTTPTIAITPTITTDDKVMSYNGELTDASFGSIAGLEIKGSFQMDGSRDAETGELNLTYDGTISVMGQSIPVKLTFKGSEDPGFSCEANPIEGKIYFQDDFEYFTDYNKAAFDKSTLQYPGNTVGTNDLDVYCPQVPTPKVDNVSVLQLLQSKGYDVVRIDSKGNTNPGECIYMQRNYLKFGKSGYQGGLVLPSVEGATGKTLHLNFFWCPMRQGSGTMDPTGLVVVVDNGDAEKTFDVPAHGLAKGSNLTWINADITLEGVDITPETKITIRPDADNWGKTSQHRWFIDNVALYDPSDMGAAIGEIEADGLDSNAPVEYYNIQGMRVDADNLPAGLYIRRQGSKATKIFVK